MASRMVIRLLLFILLTINVISGCSRRQNREIKETAENAVPAGSSYLFNGKNLDGWEITDFGPQGPVYVSGDKIVLGMGDGCTGVTLKSTFPETNYELSLEAMRISGNDFFCGVTFPSGKSFCSLIVGGWGGTVVGISCINGLDASENETTRLMRFDTERWYKIRLVVTPETVRAWIDTTQVVDLVTSGKTLSLRPEVELSKPFGIASWRTTAAVRNIRVNVIAE